jgi:RHS repeat-associated protein
LSARYSHGPGVDQPLSMERGGNSYFYLTDHQGSIRYLTDAAGAQVNLYEYDSFGRLLVRDETVPNPFAFTGREYDAETGLYFYRARYYDPNIGRFLSEDSLGLTGGDANFYGYVGNDPLNRTDPNGRLFWDIVDVVFFAWSLHDFIECPSLETGLNLLLDTVSLLPGLPSVGWASRADDVLDIVNHGDDLADGVRALDNAGDAVRGLDNVDDAWDAARRPYWDEGVQRWRDPDTGQFTRTPWPPNGGFDGPPRTEVLQPGTRIDRYGPESGGYVSPEGTPFGQRSLPAHYENTQPYNTYEVVSPIEVQAGPAAPWFGQPGGGTQYQLPDSVGNLIGGYLRRIP